MIKYLLLALLIAWLFHAAPWKQSRPDRAKSPKTPPPSLTETMVRCAHCGVHIPANEALSANNNTGQILHYCCEDHRRAGPRPC